MTIIIMQGEARADRGVGRGTEAVSPFIIPVRIAYKTKGRLNHINNLSIEMGDAK